MHVLLMFSYGIIQEGYFSMRVLKNISPLLVWGIGGWVLEIALLGFYELSCARYWHSGGDTLRPENFRDIAVVFVVPLCWLGVALWIMVARKVSALYKLCLVFAALVVLLIVIGASTRIPIVHRLTQDACCVNVRRLS